MWRRGADSDGYVANFVESEQIIQISGFRASFVQVYLFHSFDRQYGAYYNFVKAEPNIDSLFGCVKYC